MLFALRQTSVFPVDTWINKVYNDLTGEVNTNRRLISKQLSERYDGLSGYAQQYFFYYYRSRQYFIWQKTKIDVNKAHNI